MEVSALLEHWLGWDDKNHHCSSNIGDSPALHSEIETSNSMTNHSVMTPNTKSSLTGLGAPSWADRLVSHLVTGSNPTDDQQNEDPSIWVRKFCSEVGCDVLKKQDTNGKTLLHHLLSGKNSLFSATNCLFRLILQKFWVYICIPIIPTPWLTWIRFTWISLSRLFKRFPFLT